MRCSTCGYALNGGINGCFCAPSSPPAQTSFHTPKGYPLKEPSSYRYGYKVGRNSYFNEWRRWDSKDPKAQWSRILAHLRKQKTNLNYKDYWVEYRYSGGLISQGIKSSDL